MSYNIACMLIFFPAPQHLFCQQLRRPPNQRSMKARSFYPITTAQSFAATIYMRGNSTICGPCLNKTCRCIWAAFRRKNSVHGAVMLQAA